MCSHTTFRFYRHYTGQASIDMDISMDIHAKPTDMDMGGKFNIHGNPLFYQVGSSLFGSKSTTSSHSRVKWGFLGRIGGQTRSQSVARIADRMSHSGLTSN